MDVNSPVFKDLCFTAIYEREMEIMDNKIEELQKDLFYKEEIISQNEEALSEKDLRIKELENQLGGKK